jgi:hypothetical protein
MVTFIIGEEGSQETFLVHKEVACDSTPVFERAFNSVFIEGQDQNYRITDTTRGAFQLLMQWMYSRDLELKQLDEAWIANPDNKYAADEEDHELVELWVLAEKYGIPALQNRVIEAMVDIGSITQCIPNGTFPYVYENTAKGSPLRRLCVAMVATYFTAKKVKEVFQDLNYYPAEFFYELSITVMDYSKARLGNEMGVLAKQFFVSEEIVDLARN